MANVLFTGIAGQADNKWSYREGWTQVSQSTTRIDYELDDGSLIRLEGSFVLTAGGDVSSGTITSLGYFTDSSATQTFVSITGLSFDYERLPNKGNVAELFLAGDDTIEFRDRDLTINGFGGTDTITAATQSARGVTLEAAGGNITHTSPVLSSLNDTIDYRYNPDGSVNTRGVYVELQTNLLASSTQEHLFTGRAFEARTENYTSRASLAEFSDQFESINHVKTGAGNDLVRGTFWYVDANTVGGSTIRTGAGNDTIYRAYNAFGGAGDDVIHLSEAGRYDSTLGMTIGGNADGGLGDDTLYMTANSGRGTRVQNFDGGSGVDTAVLDDTGVSYASHDLGGDSEIYSSGTVSLYNHTRIDNLTDGDNDSDIAGNVFANELRGEGGEDYIVGLGGNDVIDGGAQNDRLFGGTEDDRLFGGANDDLLKGQNGRDELFGQSGRDELSGGVGNDVLKGGGGADRLEGGTGNDRLVGGTGNDTFLFLENFGRDRIKDFAATVNREKIDLSGVASIVSMTDLRKNHMTDLGDDVLINDGAGNTITLIDVDIADLNRADFVF